VRIRPATLSDLNQITAIRQAAISRHAPTVYSAREVDELLGQLGEAGFGGMVLDGRLFVAERDKRLLGTAGWTDGYLRHVHVRPGDERRGIGTRLVRHVEEDFQRWRANCEIRVNSTRNSQVFYAANGYERLPEDATVSALFIPMQKQLRQ